MLGIMVMIFMAIFAHDQVFAQSSTSSFNLPGVQLPQGTEEVRAADGTTCRSAIAGSGAYLDMGFIGNPEQGTTDSSVTAYTRIVVPLNAKRNRIDCTRLYDLEVRRLEIELKLVELGLDRGFAPSSETEDISYDDEAAQSDDVSQKEDTGSDNSDEGETSLAESTGDWDDEGWSNDGLYEEQDEG